MNLDTAPLDAIALIREILLKSEAKSFSNEADHNGKRHDIQSMLTRILENVVKPEVKKYRITNFNPTEIGQSEAAAYYLQGLIKYCPEKGWLAYDFTEGAYRSGGAEIVLNEILIYLTKERKKT